MQSEWIIDHPFRTLSGEQHQARRKESLNLSDFSRLSLVEFVSAFENARDDAPIADFAWRLGTCYDLDALGHLGKALRSAPRLGDALQVLINGFPLLQSGADIALQVEDDAVRFCYRILDNRIWPRHADAEFTLGFVASIAAAFGATPDTFRAIAFETPEDAKTSALRHAIGLDISYGGDTNSILLPARLLDNRAISASSLEDYGQALRQMASQLHVSGQDEPVARRVQHTILRRLGHAPVDQTQIAAALGMSERSLRRYLSAEQISFQALLDECRHHFAEALLVRTDLPLSEIAYRIGYGEQSTFSRAAREWFAMSPAAFRRQNRPL
ncbi:AraC-like transcriptional regulator QhpR [Notoacmeibacter ruber]|uniref:AraC-like transcriptional regulator QhpR n=1 Tax=Notoacmeibacter ruber TaxID=2670375 RepID=UPI0013146DF9|nr:AraC family transcriptional regulator [Notoacmeibacter ruber]